MEMLRAVLDTNFWLATHVVVVTLGYASTFMAGLLGVTYVLLGLFTPLLKYKSGNLELGNWRTYTKKATVDYSIREFHGRMDEFALLSRPLSTDEIRRQYELGRPRQGNSTAVAELNSRTP